MRAVRFHQYGDPEVLALEEAPEPHAGEGQVRIRVHATSVNPFDTKVRAGYLAEMMPLSLPAGIGSDAVGVVDEVGEGVGGVAIGDRVFGLANAAAAEHAFGDGGAEKFVSEVFWRTYFKGHLETHPSAWTDYHALVARNRERLAAEPGPPVRDEAIVGIGKQCERSVMTGPTTIVAVCVHPTDAVTPTLRMALRTLRLEPGR